MNIIKKAYCRVFQQCFHIAIPFLPYRKPKMLDSMEELADILNRKKISSVLLITDKGIRACRLTAHLEDVLLLNEIKCTIYDETVPNPTTDNVDDAVSLYYQNECGALIGFGGGSSMDCAKAVGACISNPDKTLAQMKGILKIHKKLPPLFAVPTTAGTGSETTVAAIITDSVTRHKYCINSFPLIPHYAVLDPEVTRSLPKSLTATTGLDALTHAVEAYIGNSTTPGTKKDAQAAVRIIFKMLPKAYADGSDLKARRKMLYAAYLAGSAFTKSYVGYDHAVAHSLGGKYNTPHGLATAVLLPHVLEAYGKSAWKKLGELALAAGLATGEDSAEEKANRFIEAIRKLESDLNIPKRIEGIKEEDIPELAAYAEKEANPLYPVPKLMDAEELEQFYYAVM